jgi:hypothetical protein
MMKGFVLPPVRFVFDGGRLNTDKLRGLKELGPFSGLNNRDPRFAFLFPRELPRQGKCIIFGIKERHRLFQRS